MSASKKILVIDDEPDERLYLSILLEDNGYETDMAEDGIEGLHKIRTSPPDLITLDITMPGKSGAILFRELRGDPAFDTIPIVIVTGVSGLGGKPDEFLKYLSSRKNTRPPEGFISKPINQRKLLDAIKTLLS